MAHSSKPTRPTRPRLYRHSTGQWCCRIHGKFYYFGRDEAEAESRLYRELPYILNGTKAPPPVVGLTLRDLCNHFLTAQDARLSVEDLSPRHFDDLKKTAKRLVDFFGPGRPVETLTPDEFARLRNHLHEKYAPSALVAEFARIKSVFNWGRKQGLLEKITFGADFRPPSRRKQLLHRESRPERFFERDELLVMLMAAGQPLEAMLLLACNGGLGNSDVATLTVEALDLQEGWLTFPRNKTGVHRRVPLWPETCQALMEVIGDRTSGLVFRTAQHNPWQPGTVSQRVTRLMQELGIDRDGVSFYSCRHVFQTQAEECGDLVAVKAIMGHADSSMSANYRRRISDERLRRAADAVRSWLFGKESDNG